MFPNQNALPTVQRTSFLVAILASLLMSALFGMPQIGAVTLLAIPVLFALHRYSQRTGRNVRGAGIVALAALVIAAQLVVPLAAQAQSASIDFDAADLDIFFLWFNTMFNAILPIGLLGAGIAAGVAFVWVVARMLTKAFTSMLGGLGGA